MGQLGHFNLDLCCGFEKSITAGKSYFAQVSVILGIVSKISESSELLDKTRLIPGVVRESYKYIDQVEKLSEYLVDFNRFFVFWTRNYFCTHGRVRTEAAGGRND